MAKSFQYAVSVNWTGNGGRGTSDRSFGRDNEIHSENKPTIIGSAPSEFAGDGVGWPPEELLVGAISQCHMLTYLFLCSRNGVVVESYEDDATGTLLVEGAAGGHFTEVTLRPRIVISDGSVELAQSLHDDAHKGCYIAGSINFDVKVEPKITKKPSS